MSGNGPRAAEFPVILKQPHDSCGCLTDTQMVDAKLQPPKSCGRLVGIGLQLEPALSSIAIRSSLLSLSLSSRPTTESGFTAAATALSPSRASIEYVGKIVRIFNPPQKIRIFSTVK